MNRRDGFSLVEVVFAMTLLAIVMSSLMVFTTSNAKMGRNITTGSLRQGYALQEMNRLSTIHYDSLPNKIGCRTFTTGAESFTRCVTYTSGTRYREVKVVITPSRSGTYSDTLIFRRVVGSRSNPLNMP